MTSQGYKPKGTIDDKYFYAKKDSEYIPNYVNVTLSALIVAKAKEIMYEEYIKIPEEDLLYTDTDSIIFKGQHIHKFNISNELGKFKIEHENKPVNIIKEKLYSIGDHVKCSGINKEGITPERLKTQETFKNWRMITLKDGLRAGSIESVGTFVEEEIHITERQKIEIELEKEIKEDETIKDTNRNSSNRIHSRTNRVI